MTTNNESNQSNGCLESAVSEELKNPAKSANSSRKNGKSDKVGSPSVNPDFVIHSVPYEPEEQIPIYSVQDALRDAAKAQREAKKQSEPTPPPQPQPDFNEQHQTPQQQIDELLSGDSIISNIQARTQQELLTALKLQRQEDLEILQRGIEAGARKRDIYAAGEQLGFARAGNQASILDLLEQVEAISQLAAQTELKSEVREKLPESIQKDLPDIDKSIDALLGETLALRPQGKRPLALGGQRLAAPQLLLAPTATEDQNW